MRKRVLIISDKLSRCQEIASVIQDSTIEANYALSKEDAIKLYMKWIYCTIIVDMCLENTDILQLLKMMRQAKPVPILVLTGATLTSEERTSLLRAGATAYLEEPFDIQECVAQTRSLIDLYTTAHPIESRYHTLAFGTELIIDPTYWQVTLNGNQIELTRKEFDLLYCLADRAGQVLTHEQIYSRVWRNDSDINVEGTIKSHISSLRQKLSVGGAKECIENVRGVGYRFTAEIKRSSDEGAKQSELAV